MTRDTQLILPGDCIVTAVISGCIKKKNHFSFPTIPCTLSFQPGPGILAPAKKGGEKKGRPAINEVVIGEHTTHIHKRIHGVGFKERAPRALRSSNLPGVGIDTGLIKAVCTKGVRNVPCRIRVRLSRKRNEDEGSPSKLCMLVADVPVSTSKNLQAVNVNEN
ncbi:large ribosomal subunit protein eL31-like [Desmodus rotundus]|uniref:large ribosomal subunit protein eL31-like n=1 Tax=Desmodus rotundus TaxID=9430 RepID=UPI0039E5E0A2